MNNHVFNKYKTGSMITEEIDKSIAQVKDCKRKIKHRKGLCTKITFGLMASMALLFGSTGFVLEATRSETPLPDIFGYTHVMPEEDLEEAFHNIGNNMAAGTIMGFLTALTLNMSSSGKGYLPSAIDESLDGVRKLRSIDKKLDKSLEDLENQKKKKLVKKL